MKSLKYVEKINAPKRAVWETMLDEEKYKEWAKAFSSESQYQGEWKEGTHIIFIDPNMGGTKAILEKVAPYNYIHAKHVATVDKDGVEDTESEVAKNWIGTTETYSLDEVDGVTELSVTTVTHESFEKMFSEGWPKAIALLKDLCERNNRA